MRPIRPLEQGFTLLEILVVIFIIGMSVSIVTLSLGGDRDDSATRKEAQAFLQAVDYVSEQAVLNGDMIAMFITPKESDTTSAKKWCYHWQRMREGEWRDLPEETLTEHCMPENIQWDLVIEGRIYTYDPDLEKQPPLLVFASSGEATPVEMAIFEHGNDADAQHIEIDMMGNIEWREQVEAEKRDGP